MELARGESALRLGAVSNTPSAHPKTLNLSHVDALDRYRRMLMLWIDIKV